MSHDVSKASLAVAVCAPSKVTLQTRVVPFGMPLTVTAELLRPASNAMGCPRPSGAGVNRFARPTAIDTVAEPRLLYPKRAVYVVFPLSTHVTKTSIAGEMGGGGAPQPEGAVTVADRVSRPYVTVQLPLVTSIGMFWTVNALSTRPGWNVVGWLRSREPGETKLFEPTGIETGTSSSGSYPNVTEYVASCSSPTRRRRLDSRVGWADRCEMQPLS